MSRDESARRAAELGEFRTRVGLPLMALVHRANREFQADMIETARAKGYPEARAAHNSLFATLPLAGARTADLAAMAGITRQSMGEVVRELTEVGLVEMTPDPTDRRAKLVTYTEEGRRQAHLGSQHIAAVEDLVREDLGEEAYHQLRRSLERVSQLLVAARRASQGEEDPAREAR